MLQVIRESISNDPYVRLKSIGYPTKSFGDDGYWTAEQTLLAQVFERWASDGETLKCVIWQLCRGRTLSAYFEQALGGSKSDPENLKQTAKGF